jgi:hypothetical protein
VYRDRFPFVRLFSQRNRVTAQSISKTTNTTAMMVFPGAGIGLIQRSIHQIRQAITARIKTATMNSMMSPLAPAESAIAPTNNARLFMEPDDPNGPGFSQSQKKAKNVSTNIFLRVNDLTSSFPNSISLKNRYVKIDGVKKNKADQNLLIIKPLLPEGWAAYVGCFMSMSTVSFSPEHVSISPLQRWNSKLRRENPEGYRDWIEQSKTTAREIADKMKREPKLRGTRVRVDGVTVYVM